MSDQVWWYATRAAGLMTWTTATASVIVGLMLSSRAVRARTGPWFLDLHRFLGGISVVFLLAHMGTLWADSYVEFGVREMFVPGASEWRPEAIAWGIIAAYVLIAVEVSSLLRTRISKGLWRAIHVLSFAAMLGGSYHAWLAGSDVKNPVTWAIAGTGSLLVLGLVSMRLQRQDPDEQGKSSLRDNREILEEMRRRLEELPIPESTPQPQISTTPNAILPRRAPIADDLPGMGLPGDDADPADPSPGFADDPFAAVPLATDEPELGDWASPSAADPFATGAVDDEAHPAHPAHPEAPASPEAAASRGPWDDGADLFESLGDDPFAALGVAPANQGDDEGFPELPPLAPPADTDEPDLFATAVDYSASDDEPAADILSSRFEPVVPTPSVIESPPADGHGPPPVPDAVDPETGEPDEAAYSAWLKEWLTYAERYGDEAPDDPTRV